MRLLFLLPFLFSAIYADYMVNPRKEKRLRLNIEQNAPNIYTEWLERRTITFEDDKKENQTPHNNEQDEEDEEEFHSDKRQARQQALRDGITA